MSALQSRYAALLLVPAILGVAGCGGNGGSDVTSGASSAISRSAHSFKCPWPFTVGRGNSRLPR
jgi:hypothetical protein